MIRNVIVKLNSGFIKCVCAIYLFVQINISPPITAIPDILMVLNANDLVETCAIAFLS